MFEFLAAARFVHFAAICILFGLAAFPFYAVGPDEDAPRFDRAVRWSAVLALLTAWVVLFAMTANIGGSAASAFDPAILSSVAGDTRFGQVWMGRIILAVVLLAVCVKRKARPGRDKALLILSGLLLAKIGLAAAMGALALANRFWITPALKRGGDRSLWLGRLHLQVSVEFALGLAVLAAAGVLGAMSPPISS